MMKIWLPSLIISSLIFAVVFYFDTTADRGPAGAPLASLALGWLVTLILFMPCYGLAACLRYRLRWPEWTRLPMVGGMWLLVWLAFYLLGPPDSGVNSWGVVWQATGQFWAGSLAYGIPSVLLSYAHPPRAAS
jgi:hypothetical protein